MVKKIAIGILAYNEEMHIESVLNEILTLDRDVYVLNDSSTDRTLDILEKINTTKNFTIINNVKNEGAGKSTLKIIERAKNDGFEFVIKVDGDNQFRLDDISKIINLHEEKIMTSSSQIDSGKMELRVKSLKIDILVTYLLR